MFTLTQAASKVVFFQNSCKASSVFAPSYVNKKQHFLINISVIKYIMMVFTVHVQFLQLYINDFKPPNNLNQKLFPSPQSHYNFTPAFLNDSYSQFFNPIIISLRGLKNQDYTTVEYYYTTVEHLLSSHLLNSQCYYNMQPIKAAD